MENPYQHISLTLKGLRQAKGWSLDKAALETGVSKAMLGQIERQESSPTIATLWKIATGFKVSFSSFIEDESAGTHNFMIRKKVTQSLHPSDSKIKVATLFPFDAKLNFEVFKIDLLPGCDHLSEPHQKGVIEHVVVVTGKVEVFAGNRWHKLAEGDGFSFAADQPHGYRNLTKHVAHMHDIIHY